MVKKEAKPLKKGNNRKKCFEKQEKEKKSNKKIPKNGKGELKKQQEERIN